MSQPVDLRLVEGLTLNDLLRSLVEDDYLLPPEINIALVPPINSDEDSGDEEYLNINNLPGSQLLASAEVMTKDTDVDEDAGNATAVGLNLNASRESASADNWDEEDDIPVSVFQAVKKICKWSEKQIYPCQISSGQPCIKLKINSHRQQNYFCEFLMKK